MTTEETVEIGNSVTTLARDVMTSELHELRVGYSIRDCLHAAAAPTRTDFDASRRVIVQPS